MKAKHSGVAKLWLLNLFGNAALLAAFYFWLLLPDAHAWQVAGSGLAALLVVFSALWLRTGSFAYFRLAVYREEGAVWRAFQAALHHMIALAVCAAPFAALEWSLFFLRQYAPQFGVWLWQKVPALRFGSPRALFHVSDWLLLILMWLLAVTWVPVASTVAALGLKAARMIASWRVLKRPRYWAWCVTLGVVGLYLPYKLVWWIPGASTLNRQAWSAGVRFLFAYLLLMSAWVSLLLVVGELVEAEDQLPEAKKP